MPMVQAFDRAGLEGSGPDETPMMGESHTMGDPRSEGRGLVTGALLAAAFWAGFGAFLWWLLR